MVCDHRSCPGRWYHCNRQFCPVFERMVNKQRKIVNFT
jgi:hypothetical protein